MTELEYYQHAYDLMVKLGEEGITKGLFGLFVSDKDSLLALQGYVLGTGVSLETLSETLESMVDGETPYDTLERIWDDIVK